MKLLVLTLSTLAVLANAEELLKVKTDKGFVQGDTITLGFLVHRLFYSLTLFFNILKFSKDISMMVVSANGKEYPTRSHLRCWFIVTFQQNLWYLISFIWNKGFVTLCCTATTRGFLRNVRFFFSIFYGRLQYFHISSCLSVTWPTMMRPDVPNFATYLPEIVQHTELLKIVFFFL